MPYSTIGGFPDLDTLRLEIGVPATVYSDEKLLHVAGSEQEGIAAGYDWGDPTVLPDKLYRVFVRSVARAVAADGVVLGILAADAEYGTVRLSTRDSEITRVGGAFRKRGFA
jgi:hypothetical protein